MNFLLIVIKTQTKINRKLQTKDLHRVIKIPSDTDRQSPSIMIHQDQNLKQNSRLQNISSDQECDKQKIQTQKKRKQPNLQTQVNQDVIDEKEEVRQVSVKVENQEEEILHELIKEEYLERMETKYEELENECERQIVEEIGVIQVENLKQKPEPQQQGTTSSARQQGKSPQLNKDKKSPSSKSLTKSLSSTSSSKYLQPNSPQLFISPRSMLPNQIVCVQNNSTRVIVHMNKKIVPIPSSYGGNSNKKDESPERSRATLPSVQCPYLLGKLVVTNYKIAYMDSLYPNTMTFVVPLNYLSKIQRTHQQSTGLSYIELCFKTGLSVKFKYHQEQYSYSQKIKDIITTLMHKNLYAALDLGQQQIMQPFLCKTYCESYFNQANIQKEIKGIQAQIIHNLNWQQMTGYPEKYVIPLRYIGKTNTQTRLVILSYVYTLQQQKITLWRTGPGNPDPSQDEWISKAKYSDKHHIIQVKNKGIGISKTQASRLVQIETLYLLRQSFHKVHQLFYHNHDSVKWMGNMCTTRWYQQVAILMNQALRIIQVMSQKSNVTLVCDTQGRGAQIAAIVQLLMNPFYRTFEGFPWLIQKEFLHFGCPKAGKKQREQDKSIILIQFLDCVYQFTHLYPLSFEFSEYYLVYLGEHVFSNKYGNFFYITRQLKKETDRRQVVEKCVCIWQDIKRKMQTDSQSFMSHQQQIIRQQQMKKPMSKKPSKKNPPPIHQTINYHIYFRNSFYVDHNESNIFELKNHSQVSKGIKLWTSYFSKKVYCAELVKQQVLFCNQIQKRYFKIGHQHILMKNYNETMRKKLSQQYAKIAQKKNFIKSLKQL